MRKLISTFTVLAALTAPVAFAGCGTDDVDPAAIAQAAERTRSADSAAMRLQVVAKGFGLPLPMTVSGEGVTSLTRPDLEMTLDLGPLAALAGAGTGAGGDGKVRVRVEGKDVAVDPPPLEGFSVPDGATWLTLDLEKTIEAMGIDAAGLGEIMTIDPGAQLDVLRSADGVEALGTEKVDGVETTHYRGTVRIEDFIARLPEPRRAAARKALDALEAQTETADDATPFEVWIDADDRIRRTVQRIAVPAQPGVKKGEMTITIDLAKFGARLDPAGIPQRDAYDVTSDVTGALSASQ